MFSRFRLSNGENRFRDSIVTGVPVMRNVVGALSAIREGKQPVDITLIAYASKDEACHIERNWLQPREGVKRLP